MLELGGFEEAGQLKSVEDCLGKLNENAVEVVRTYFAGTTNCLLPNDLQERVEELFTLECVAAAQLKDFSETVMVQESQARESVVVGSNQVDT